MKNTPTGSLKKTNGKNTINGRENEKKDSDKHSDLHSDSVDAIYQLLLLLIRRKFTMLRRSPLRNATMV